MEPGEGGGQRTTNCPAQFGWDMLPFNLVRLVVDTLLSRPPLHQAHHAVAALRRISRHWRAAVDDSLLTYSAQHRGPLLPLHRWPNLRTLNLEHCALGPTSCEGLAAFARLTSLSLTACGQPLTLGPAALASIPHSLRELHLVDVAFDGLPTLAPLRACTVLQTFTLELASTRDLSADVAALACAWPHLRRLAVYRCVRAYARHAQQPFDLGQTAGQLTSLQLAGSFTEDEGWAELFPSLCRLKHLDIRVSPFLGDDGFLGITALAPTLTSLSLQGDGRLTPNGITALAQLTGLHSLALAWCSARVASRALLPLISFKLSQLTHLNISGCRWTDLPLSFDHLTNLRQLRSLVARECGLLAEHCASLGRLTGLETLELSANPGLRGFRQLSGLAQLTSLGLVSVPAGDFSFLSRLSRLQRLALAPLPGKADEDRVAQLRNGLLHVSVAAASQLTALHLVGCPVDEGCLERMGALTALRRLGLTDCYWEDPGTAAAAAAGGQGQGPAGQLAGQQARQHHGTAGAGGGGHEGHGAPDRTQRSRIDPSSLVALLRRLPRLDTLLLESTAVGEGWQQLAAEQLPGPTVLQVVGVPQPQP